MKLSRVILLAPLVGFTGCSTPPPASHVPAKVDSETVLVTYHVRAGKETELQGALAHAWEIYRQQPLVFARPHVIIRETEDGGKTRFVEVLTWISRSTPEHAPDCVREVWGR